MYIKDLEDAGTRDEWFMIDEKTKHPRVFPCALLSWLPPPYTIRERAMMAFVAGVVDKDGWCDKVFNDEIVEKWGDELEEGIRRAGFVDPDKDPEVSGNGTNNDGDANVQDGAGESQATDPQVTGNDDDGHDESSEHVQWLECGFSDEMNTYCIEELRDKAKLYQKVGFVEVLEHHAAIFVSDDAVDEQLREELIAAVKPLEDVPDADKDWHPGSDGKVLDLVHPSLWPLVFGKTRAADHDITLDECLDSIGSGEVIPVAKGYETSSHHRPLLSAKFQWLPAEVDIDNDGTATFKSYINNLHPSNKDLYHVLERLVSKFLPLWSATYDRVVCSHGYRSAARSRIKFFGGVKEHCRLGRAKDAKLCDCPERYSRPPSGWRPAGWAGDPGVDDSDEESWVSDEDDELREAWTSFYDEQHIIAQPEPFDFEPFDEEEVAANYQTQGPWFGTALHKPTSRLQIIVKLATIHLTPEKPRYDGGSWHIEGALNESICATGLYYYDNENITESYLSFRGGTDGDSMRENFKHEQNDHRQFEATYGAFGKDSSVLEVGSVRTKQGRLLAFPNVLQHCVGDFELVDKSKPGHRKIVALFLVDPATPVISTANVPPQQKHWASDDSTIGKLGKRLPQELQTMVYDHIECPYGFEEACKLREELMEERKAIDDASDWKLSTTNNFNLCEH